MTVHVVEPGECMTSLAARYGLASVEPLLAANRALLAYRHPNLLAPGDRVTIPARRREVVVAAPGAHTFVVGVPPARLRLRLEDSWRGPLGPTAARLTVGGATRTIAIGADGRIDETVPPEATGASLELLDGAGVARTVLHLRIGHLAPPETARGLAQRLDNLGLHAGADVGAAVRRFRAYRRWRDPGFDPAVPGDGEAPDEILAAALKEAHGA